MAKILHVLLTLWIGNSVFSQSQSFNIPISIPSNNRSDFQQKIDLSALRNADFIALSIRMDSLEINQNSRISLTNGNDEYIFSPFEDSDLQQNTFVGNLLYLTPKDADVWTLNVKINTDASDAKKLNGFLRVFVPQERNDVGVPDFNYKELEDCSCPMPSHIKRQDWGAQFGLGSQIYKPPAAYTQVSHLIVHHSAGTNVSNNWKGVVASIFDFHVNTNGWQDVGYNWLIDPNGVIYEGRGGGDNVRGAHMCGYNNNTMGVCMLGNFELIEPKPEMIESLKKLLSYKACKETINPKGSSTIVSHTGFMKNISGHKDGCAPNHTSCPGKFLYEKMEQIREETDLFINEECNPITSIEVENVIKDVIFPMPVENRLCINNDFDEFVISSIDGQDFTHLYQKVESHCIDVAELSSGIYFLTIAKNKKLTTTKFIKL